jgi:prevent-host-death family protein
MEAGVQDVKKNLGRSIKRIQAGERVVITSHGAPVAELVPPSPPRVRWDKHFESLIAAGVVTPPSETVDPLEGCWPDIGLPEGTAAALINEDRDED